MRVFITGVSCVGKTTVGRKLAELLGVEFLDLDHEIEVFFGTSIERLQNRFLTTWSYQEEAAKALIHLLRRPNSGDCVIALPPSGLMGAYLRAVRKWAGTTVVLVDRPENILQRITFYDIESRRIEKHVTPREEKIHLEEIRKDISYFRKSYQRAHLQVDISGLDADGAARKVKETLQGIGGGRREQGRFQPDGGGAPSNLGEPLCRSGQGPPGFSSEKNVP